MRDSHGLCVAAHMHRRGAEGAVLGAAMCGGWRGEVLLALKPADSLVQERRLPWLPGSHLVCFVYLGLSAERALQ